MPDFVITLPVVESAAFSVNPVATKGSTTITLDTTAPVIQSVTLAPNPVDAGNTYIITVAVGE